MLDSWSGISTMSESVTAKSQAAVHNVQIVGPVTDEQYVEMADGKLVQVEQKSCPVRTVLHTTWGPVGLARYFAGQGGRGDLGQPNSRGLGN